MKKAKAKGKAKPAKKAAAKKPTAWTTAKVPPKALAIFEDVAGAMIGDRRARHCRP